MTLHIRNTIDDGDSVLKLSGRIRSDDVSELQKLIATNNGRVVLDLEEVNLVDRSVVEYLGLWEREGLEIRCDESSAGAAASRAAGSAWRASAPCGGWLCGTARCSRAALTT